MEDKSTEIKRKLEQQLSAKRYKHTLGVSDIAVQLAQRFGCDVHKARLAGLLHDCAREMSVEDLLSKAREFGIVLDDVEKYEPVLLHAPIAGYLAKVCYGIEDEEIIQAVSLHTTGSAKMTQLDKIIYLADMIEPGRSFPGVEELRLLAEKDLDKALLASLEQSILHVLKGKGLIHPGTIEARNQLIMKKTKKQ